MTAQVRVRQVLHHTWQPCTAFQVLALADPFTAITRISDVNQQTQAVSASDYKIYLNWKKKSEKIQCRSKSEVKHILKAEITLKNS